MPDETIVLVKKMIDYVYTGDYSDLLDSPTDNPVDPKEPLPPISVLQLHAQIFILGDKYCIAELCDTAVEKYLTRIEEQFDPLEFLDSLPDVFFTELEKNMELRTAAIRISRQRLVSCFQDAAVRGKYESIAAQVPGFVRGLLGTFLDAQLLGTARACGPGNPMLASLVKCRGCGRGRRVPHSHFSPSP
ncbi:hypothetical protein N7470_009352 [Penicillium chermesinum]|nr:hypothetical protein N7470_009352 [Penicillium chermesinum]